MSATTLAPAVAAPVEAPGYGLRMTGALTARHLRNLARQPWWIAIALVQPMIWLLLYGALFKNIVEIPGFGSGPYIDFLAPGVVVMTALFSSAWTGMGVIEDLERGVMDRLLVSPVGRGPVIAGALVQQSVMICIQALLVLGVGWLVGANFAGGVGGVVVLVVVSVLMAWGMGALSLTVAILARQQETLVGAAQLVLLPLTFLSSMLISLALAPGWIRTVATYNPVNWALDAAREALAADPNWSTVGSRTAYLAGFAVVCSVLAVRAFRSYQRAI